MLLRSLSCFFCVPASLQSATRDIGGARVNLQQLWYRRTRWVWPWVPLSLIYCSAVTLRRHAYKKGWLSSFEAGVPVVMVGNVTVGGTGKTPVVIALAQWLREQGWRPAIVSRGYGGRAGHAARRVHPDSDPRDVGDEPVLLARHTECPVAVCRRRIEAVSLLLGETDCDLILTDDGLQHYALHRDIELCIISGARRLGNGWCLPAGPLREPASRLGDVDYVLSVGAAGEGEWPVQRIAGQLRSVDTAARRAPLHELRGERVHGVAGIGDPQPFFATLRDAGLNVIEHAFRDHHVYSAADLVFAEDLPIVMTEKDAVKCQKFGGARTWYLESFVRLDPAWLQLLASRLVPLRAQAWSRRPRRRR